MLILSFSGIENDGRVLRQIDEFSRDFDVTTCGAGEQPRPGVTHVRVEHVTPAWARHAQGLLLHLKQYRLAYWVVPYIREARRRLKAGNFDVVIANDLTAAGVAAAIAPGSRTLLDLHEYWPGLHDDVAEWRKLREPYHRWLLRAYAGRAAARTTVSQVIADRYHAEFGFDVEVVANASVLRELSPVATSSPLRFVHSGIAKPARRIEVMMRAVAASTTGATLDLYLTGVGSDYHRGLQRLAAELGERIRIVPPVPHAELIGRLNHYDVGLPFLPPTTTNIRLCLPNKFFDYVQARLAIVSGPTQAMADLIAEHDLGVVTESFEVEALTAAVDALSTQTVAGFKEHTDVAAHVLAGETQIAVWRRIVDRIQGKVESE